MIRIVKGINPQTPKFINSKNNTSTLRITPDDIVNPTRIFGEIKRKPPRTPHRQMVSTPTKNPKVIEFLKKASEIQPEDLPKYDGTTIPKIIHFCYINYKNIPAEHDVLFLAWMEHLKDYTFINWIPEKIPENHFINFSLTNKKWAFFADYARVYAVEKYGGFYMDCDVMVYKSFDELLKFPYIFDVDRRRVDENNMNRVIECGSFGAQPENKLIKTMREYYDSLKPGFSFGSNFVAPWLWAAVAKNNHIIIDIEFSKHLKGAPGKNGKDYYNESLNIDVYYNTVINNPNVIYTLDSTYLSKPNKDMYSRYCIQHPHDQYGVFPWAFTSHQYYTEWSITKPSKDS